MATVDLKDPSLFGSEAAELEDEEVFYSYAIERPLVQDFLRENDAIRIASAYKGEGKSALLRLAKSRLASAPSSPLIISCTAASISPDLATDNLDTWIKKWKLNILGLVAREIGAKISFAVSDDATTLVEEAERNGFRSRSIFGYFLDRTKTKGAQVEQRKPDMPNPEQLLKRWLADKAHVWLLIDDADHNYAETPLYLAKLSSFLGAIRELVGLVPELRIRFTIRPNVWKSIKRRYEGASHFRESIVEISWGLIDCKDMLAKRVESYLQRKNEWKKVDRTLTMVPHKRSEQLNNFILEPRMPWGGGTRRSTSVLHTLSRHRPRWLIELAKEAGKAAAARQAPRINYDDVMAVMQKFSKNRLDDTIAEFGSQCSNLEDVLIAFAREHERFTTDELMKAINNRVLQQVQPSIVGVTGKATAMEVAHFLYEIGFLTARRDFPDGSYEHVAYADNPDLLSVKTNVDQGYKWEIHPVFRQALQLKSVS